MATRIPDPVQTPEGPTYEGRLLDRPDEEVVDQGANFDVRTLMSRRALIGAGLIGIGTVALAACTPRTSESGSASGLSSGEIPDETAGPYPGDGSNGPDVLEESGIVRRDIRSSVGVDDPVDGVPLEFTLTVVDMANGDAPFEGAAVYAWHCDAQGRYSMYSEGVEGESWLRGVQVADSDGKVTFTSIVPGCYTGRWPHIHFEVYPDVNSISDSANAIATSQMAFPEEMLTGAYDLAVYDGAAQNLSRITLATDNVFGEDSAALQMATITGNLDAGYGASLVVRVDTATEPMAGAGPGGGGAPSGGGPGGGAPGNGGAPGGPGSTPRA